MDEYTADPKETEREAQRVLRDMKNNKARAEVADIAKEEKAKRIAENEYKKVPGNTRASGGGGGMGGNKLSNRDLTKAYKSGGKVTASSRADGIAIRGKTRA